MYASRVATALVLAGMCGGVLAQVQEGVTRPTLTPT